MATRKAGARLGRLATVLAAVIAGLLASAAAVPAAVAGDRSVTGLAGCYISSVTAPAAIRWAARHLVSGQAPDCS